MTEDTARERVMARRARERAEDREAGRPQRGLFTGRGRKGTADSDADDARERYAKRDDAAHDDIGDDYDDDGDERPRTGAKRSIMGAIRQIPSYLRLLAGLMGDGRVSRLDRGLVLAAVVYVLSPLDFIPDIIPFLGEVDDILLVVLAMQRLIDNAGRRVLLDHWKGDPDDLSDVNLKGLISAAGFFLPAGIRRGIKRMVHRD